MLFEHKQSLFKHFSQEKRWLTKYERKCDFSNIYSSKPNCLYVVYSLQHYFVLIVFLYAQVLTNYSSYFFSLKELKLLTEATCHRLNFLLGIFDTIV